MCLLEENVEESIPVEDFDVEVMEGELLGISLQALAGDPAP
jgi:hypothetical protein